MAEDRREILSWGANSYGQLCCGHKQDILCPGRAIPSPANGNIVRLTGGGGHTILISSKGELYTCGWNNKGQLGLNDIVDRTSLTNVPNLPMITTVSCGWNHTMAITADGRLFVFGSNAFGQLGLGTVGRSHSSPTLCQVYPGCRVLHVAAGLRHSIVLLDDGSVWSWGDNKRCQLGISGLKNKTVGTPTKVTALQERVSQVASGSHHSAVVTVSGKVFCWGSNQHGQCGKPVQLESSKYTSENETLSHCHGNSYEEPQLLSGALSNEKVKELYSGWSHLLVKTEKNHVFSWGRADYGQLGVGDDIVSQGYSYRPTKVPGLDGVTQILCGAEHNIALLDAGKVFTWGWNEHGICGYVDECNVHTPRSVPITNECEVVLVSCGGGHTFIVTNRK